MEFRVFAEGVFCNLFHQSNAPTPRIYFHNQTEGIYFQKYCVIILSNNSRL